MQITKELTDYIARLSKIKLSDEEAESMQKELGVIIEYMDILNKADTAEIEAEEDTVLTSELTGIFSDDLFAGNILREDIASSASSYKREELLKNAEVLNGDGETVVVPKIIF